jgi:hypothetical protein
MASTKRSSGGTRKSTASRSRAASTSKGASGTRSAKPRSNGRATTAQAPKPKTTRASAATGSRNGAKKARSGTAARGTTPSRNGTGRTSGSTRARAASQANGAGTVLKQKGSAMLEAADRASGPAITIAAAVAGLAGGLALRQRSRPLDAGIAARSRNVLRDVDPAAVLEGLGKATVHLSKRSKTIARELDQVADRAERLGKILS